MVNITQLASRRSERACPPGRVLSKIARLERRRAMAATDSHARGWRAISQTDRGASSRVGPGSGQQRRAVQALASVAKVAARVDTTSVGRATEKTGPL